MRYVSDYGEEDTSYDPIPVGDKHQSNSLQSVVSLSRPDFLVVLATVSGKRALRNLMLPTLAEMMAEHRDECFMSVVTRTFNCVRDVEDEQVPIVFSTLRRSLVLGSSFDNYEEPLTTASNVSLLMPCFIRKLLDFFNFW